MMSAPVLWGFLRIGILQDRPISHRKLVLGTWVNKGYLRGPGPLREERPRSCFLPTTGKDTGPGFLYGSSSVSSPVRSHVAALPTTLFGSSGASIIVTAVLNSTSVARRSLYILCFSHLGGT